MKYLDGEGQKDSLKETTLRVRAEEAKFNKTPAARGEGVTLEKHPDWKGRWDLFVIHFNNDGERRDRCIFAEFSLFFLC